MLLGPSQGRQGRRRRLPPSGYREYIDSPAWGMRSAQFRMGTDRGGRCAACRSPRFLEAHHWTYQHLGHERNYELVSLCPRDHALVHRIAQAITGRRAGALWLITPLVVLAGRLCTTRRGRYVLAAALILAVWYTLHIVGA